MNAHRFAALALLVVGLGVGSADVVGAQSKKNAKDSTKTPKDSTKQKAPKDTGEVSKFFQSEAPLTATLTTNIKRIRGDKSADAPWRPATFTYSGPAPDTATVTVPVRIRTRGIWRLKTCEFPPLRLNFKSEDVKGTIFKGLDEPKLVNYCRNTDEFEQYVLQELQLYRALRLLTPVSHAVRAIKLTYADSASGKKEVSRWAFVVEEPNDMAARLGGKMLKVQGAGPDDLEPYYSALVGVFQYMIGNTDFSLSALHNAELVAMANGEFVPVVYDFDFAGAVNARYATVDPKLGVRRVRDRLYRGYCVPRDVYPRVFTQFNAKKDSIYALYSDQIGKLLKPDIATETLKYFDEFYKTINDPKRAKEDIMDACTAGKK
jgi:hypothetical protein